MGELLTICSNITVSNKWLTNFGYLFWAFNINLIVTDRQYGAVIVLFVPIYILAWLLTLFWDTEFWYYSKEVSCGFNSSQRYISSYVEDNQLAICVLY